MVLFATCRTRYVVSVERGWYHTHPLLGSVISSKLGFDWKSEIKKGALRMVWRTMKESKSPFSGTFFDTLFLSRNREHALMASEVKQAQTPLENVKSGTQKKETYSCGAILRLPWAILSDFSEVSPKHSNFYYVCRQRSHGSHLALCCEGRTNALPVCIRCILGGSFWAFRKSSWILWKTHVRAPPAGSSENFCGV